MCGPATQHTRYTAIVRLNAHIASYVNTVSSVTDINNFKEELIYIPTVNTEWAGIA
jgi:hypothetical protein